MITKRAVVGMLNDSHDLNNVIAQTMYFGEDMKAKVLKRMDFFFGSTHTDVALVHPH